MTMSVTLASVVKSSVVSVVRSEPRFTLECDLALLGRGCTG